MTPTFAQSIFKVTAIFFQQTLIQQLASLLPVALCARRCVRRAMPLPRRTISVQCNQSAEISNDETCHGICSVGLGKKFCDSIATIFRSTVSDRLFFSSFRGVIPFPHGPIVSFFSPFFVVSFRSYRHYVYSGHRFSQLRDIVLSSPNVRFFNCALGTFLLCPSVVCLLRLCYFRKRGAIYF